MFFMVYKSFHRFRRMLISISVVPGVRPGRAAQTLHANAHVVLAALVVDVVDVEIPVLTFVPILALMGHQ